MVLLFAIARTLRARSDKSYFDTSSPMAPQRPTTPRLDCELTKKLFVALHPPSSTPFTSAPKPDDFVVFVPISSVKILHFNF